MPATAILQALFALVSKSAGKVLNAIFGWAVRALFGQTTSREQTFLSAVVGAAVAWPLLLVGLIAPKVAAAVLAFVPIPHWIPSWVVRLVWLGLAVIVPLVVGLAVASKAPPRTPPESFRGLGIAAITAILTVNLLLVSGALALSLVMPGWAAGLAVSGLTLAIAAVVGVVSWQRRVRDPMVRTRRALKENVKWAKERVA